MTELRELWQAVSAKVGGRKTAVVLVAGTLVAVGVVVPLVFLGVAITDQRTTAEWYEYLLLVRVTNSSSPQQLMAPTPNFPELLANVSVQIRLLGFNNANVTQQAIVTSRGLMLLYEFSESFAAYGRARSLPGLANGTLTLSSQVSNTSFFFLSNSTSGAEVTILLLYERIESCCLTVLRHSFIGTIDPRLAPHTGTVVTDDYLQFLSGGAGFYRKLNEGWGPYPLEEGTFSTLT